MNQTLKKILDSITGIQTSTPPYMPSSNYPIPGLGNTASDTGMNQGNEIKDPAFDDFMSRIAQQPNRDDYKPSMLRKIGASIVGLGSGSPAGMWGGVPVGYKANPNLGEIQDNILSGPYKDAVTDWKIGLDPSEKAATIERQNNTQERIAKGQEQSAKDRERGLDIREGRYEDLTKQEAERQKVREAKLELDKLKATNKNLKIYEVKDGNVMAFDPSTGEMKDTGIASGKLSDVEKANLNVQNAETLEEVRQKNRLTNIGATQGAIDARSDRVQDSITSRSGTNSQTPSQQFGDRRNRAIDLINQHPEYREFFQTDNSGTPNGVMADKPTGYFSGDKATKYDEAKNLFLGAEDKPAVSTKTAPQSNAGKTHVRLKSDKTVTGWVTNPNLDKYEVIP